MRRFRVPLSALMLAVAIVAVDIALLRACYGWSLTVQAGGVTTTTAINPIIFALSVLPFGSLLVHVAGVRLAQLFRHGGEATFFVGFQVFGWAAVFLCLVAVTPNHGRVIDALERLLQAIEPLTRAVGRRIPLPFWNQFLDELVFEYAPVAGLLGLPQLGFALFGGWLVRRAGIVVRIERRSPPAQGSSVLPLTAPPG